MSYLAIIIALAAITISALTIMHERKMEPIRKLRHEQRMAERLGPNWKDE